MKSEWVRRFIRLGRNGEAMLWDNTLALYPYDYSGHNAQIGCEHALSFNIVERASRKSAGKISLRIGDSAEQFYLGHIGYHIDPPFRGHGYAARACGLCASALATFGLRTVVITTDPDNLPSIKTCQKLNCELECTVRVPRAISERLDISSAKRRYIWTLPGNAKTETVR